MGKADVHPVTSEQLLRPLAEQHVRAPVLRVQDGKIMPAQASVTTPGQGLEKRFFGGEASGERLGEIAFRSALCQLLARENARSEAIAPLFQGSLNPIDLGYVHTQTQHPILGNGYDSVSLVEAICSRRSAAPFSGGRKLARIPETSSKLVNPRNWGMISMCQW